MCGRGERLALALAREQINGIIEVPAKARVEVDIFELQRDSQYETTDTSEQGHGGAGVRQAGLLPPSLPQPNLFWPPLPLPSWLHCLLLPRDGAAECVGQQGELQPGCCPGGPEGLI